jgi:hypothetical protein
MPSTPGPGVAPYNSIVPAGSETYNYGAWEGRIVSNLLTNLNSGNPAVNGQPGGWNSQQYGDWREYQYMATHGGLNGGQVAALTTFVRNGGMDGDAPALGWGARPPATEQDYLETPQASAQRLAWSNYDLNERQQDFAEQKFAIELALRNSASSGGGGSTSRASSGGGGGGFSGGYAPADPNDLAKLALQQAALDLEAEIARGRLNLDTLQFEADKAYKAATLAQNQSQFSETMAYNKDRDAKNQALQMYEAQNKRASEVADLSANPADWVQRDYFTRGRGSPVGQRMDAFTGEAVAPGTGATLPQVMTENMGAMPAQTTLPGLNAAGTGVGADANPAAANPLFTPDPAPVPGMAHGSAHRARGSRGRGRMSNMLRPIASSNGMVNDPAALVGEGHGKKPGPHAEMLVNPTGAPFAVIPKEQLPEMKRSGSGWLPGYDEGTPYGWDATTLSSLNGATYNQENSGSGYYAPPAYNLPTYTKSGGGNLNYSPSNTGTGTTLPTDPYFATPYEGMAGTDLVQNRNSPWYGRTVEEAYRAQLAQNATGGLQQYNKPFDESLGAGGLTEAQLSQGMTQSVNPRLPGYVSPIADPTDPGVLAGVQPVGPGIPVAADSAGGATKPSLANDQVHNGVPVVEQTTAEKLAYPAGKVADGNAAYKEVIGYGEIKSPDGGGTMTLQKGDFAGPLDKDGNPTYYEWNPLLKSWQPKVWTPTMITSAEQFRLLPPELQQQILSGKATGYMIASTPGNDWMTNMRVGMNNTGGGAFQAAANENSRMLTPEEFWAADPATRQRLLEGTGPNTQGAAANYYPGSVNVGEKLGQGTPGVGGFTGMFRLPGVQSDEGGRHKYGSYLQTKEQYESVYGPPPDYLAMVNQGAGGLPATTPPATTPPAGTPPATPPATTPPATTPPATTPPPGPPTGPDGTTPLSEMNLNDLLDYLKGPSGLSVLNYSGETIQNSPSLQFLNGTITPEQWQYTSAQETTVPALGVTLPAPSSLNYGNLTMLQKQDPAAFAAMVGLWKAGNRDLQSELLIARERAPMGSAYNTSLIKTY